MLYHAMSAEIHHRTFLFAALDGDDGGWAFFRGLKANGHAEPVLLVELNGLGFALPRYVAVGPQFLPAREKPTEQFALDTAFRVAHFQGLDTDAAWFGTTPLFGVPPSVFTDEPRNWPRIYFYSTYSSEMTPHYFRLAHDFLAFFLGGFDKSLGAQAS